MIPKLQSLRDQSLETPRSRPELSSLLGSTCGCRINLKPFAFRQEGIREPPGTSEPKWQGRETPKREDTKTQSKEGGEGIVCLTVSRRRTRVCTSPRQAIRHSFNRQPKAHASVHVAIYFRFQIFLETGGRRIGNTYFHEYLRIE